MAQIQAEFNHKQTASSSADPRAVGILEQLEFVKEQLKSGSSVNLRGYIGGLLQVSSDDKESLAVRIVALGAIRGSMHEAAQKNHFRETVVTAWPIPHDLLLGIVEVIEAPTDEKLTTVARHAYVAISQNFQSMIGYCDPELDMRAGVEVCDVHEYGAPVAQYNWS